MKLTHARDVTGYTTTISRQLIQSSHDRKFLVMAENVGSRPTRNTTAAIGIDVTVTQPIRSC